MTLIDHAVSEYKMFEYYGNTLYTLRGTSNFHYLNILNEIFNTFIGIYDCFIFVNFITIDHSKDTRILVCLTGLKNKKSRNSHADKHIVEYHITVLGDYHIHLCAPNMELPQSW